MNILFRIFVALGALVVVALFAALIAPYFINWDEFTDEFEREASRMIGQPVQVGGDTEIRLLPLPSLDFKEVKVGRNDDGSAMMTIENFSLQAELFPFLSGEIRIVEMNMERPQIHVEVEENGTIAWTSPRGLIVNPEQVNIEKLNVSNGELVVSGLAGGRELTVEKFNAVVSAKGLTGPWRIDADADVEGEPARLKIQTGILQEDRSIRLKVEAEQSARPYRILLDGPLSLKENVLEWAGEFSVAPFSDTKVAEMIIPREPLPVLTEGQFVAGPDTIRIDDYRMEIGSQADPYTITGNGSIAIGDEVFFRFKADGRQIDLDGIKAAENQDEVNTLEARLAAVRSILERIPVPNGDGEINMILPALVAGDTYVRDVSAVFRPIENGWNVASFSAKFPGNTTLEAKGNLGLFENFGFGGKIVLASRQPSGFASWVTGNVDPAFRALSKFGVSADIDVSQNNASITDMELRLDKAVLGGELKRTVSADGRSDVVLKLDGNQVNVDSLRAIYSLFQTPMDTKTVAQNMDIDVTADVLEARLGDEVVLAQGVDTKITVRNGAVSLDRLNAESFYGAQIRSRGNIEDVLSKPNGNMEFMLTSPNLDKLLRFSKSHVSENRFIETLLSDPALTQDAELVLELDTSVHTDGSLGKLIARGNLGGTNVDMTIGFAGNLELGGKLPVSIAGTVRNDAPSVLMRQLGVETLPVEFLGEVPGPMIVILDMEGKPASGMQTQNTIQLADTNIFSTGMVRTKDWSSFSGDLSITVSSPNITPYAMVAGLKVPGLVRDEVLPVSLNLKLVSDEGNVRFDDLEGQIGGNGFNGKLLYAVEGVSRPKLTGSMHVDVIDVAMIAESVFGRQSLLLGNVADNLGLDTTAQNFTSPYYQGVDASLDVSSDRILYSPGLRGQDAGFKLVMLDGAIDLNDLKFKLLDGRFSGSAGLKNTDGTVLANLRYEFSDLNIAKFARLMEMPDFLSGVLSAQGAAEATGQSLEALVANLAGNGVLNLKDVYVAGFSPEGFDDILLETGSEEYEIASEGIQALVRDALLVSHFQVASIEAPFSMSRGEVRVRNVNAEIDTTDLVGDLTYSLPDEQVSAKLDVTFDPGRRDTIEGAEPQIALSWAGALTDPQSAMDTDNLESYLSLRAFEESQRRVETLEAQVLEKQRMLQQIAFSLAKEQHIERLREIEALRLEEERRKHEEEEARKQAEEEARKEAARLEAERLEKERLEAERRERELREKALQEAARLEAEKRAKAEQAAAQRKKREEEAARKAKAQREAELAKERLRQNEAAENARANEEENNPIRRNLLKNLEDFLKFN